jgi:hypothetical protein
MIFSFLTNLKRKESRKTKFEPQCFVAYRTGKLRRKSHFVARLPLTVEGCCASPRCFSSQNLEYGIRTQWIIAYRANRTHSFLSIYKVLLDFVACRARTALCCQVAPLLMLLVASQEYARHSLLIFAASSFCCISHWNTHRNLILFLESRT